MPVTVYRSPERARIETWMHEHAAWIDASPGRQRLHTQWMCVVQWFGPDSAAARGILLEFVRLAWGHRGAHCDLRDGVWVCWHTANREGRNGCSEVEALLAALEAAPCL